jgi:hypothetical protein
VIVEQIIGLPAVLQRCRRANKNKPNEMLMTDNRIELEEPVVRRAQQDNRNKKVYLIAPTEHQPVQTKL